MLGFSTQETADMLGTTVASANGALRRGRKTVVRTVPDPFRTRGQVRLVATRANGQLVFGAYAWNPDEGCFTPLSPDVLTLDGAIATDVTSIVAPYTGGAGRERLATEVFGPFGLAPCSADQRSCPPRRRAATGATRSRSGARPWASRGVVSGA